jgi:hypothetical protein
VGETYSLKVVLQARGPGFTGIFLFYLDAVPTTEEGHPSSKVHPDDDGFPGEAYLCGKALLLSR